MSVRWLWAVADGLFLTAVASLLATMLAPVIVPGWVLVGLFTLLGSVAAAIPASIIASRRMARLSIGSGSVRGGWLPVFAFFGLEGTTLAVALVAISLGLPLVVALIAVLVLGLIVSIGSERWLRRIGSASSAISVIAARPAQARLFTV